MALPASDSLLVDDGFAADASDAMPGFDDGAMPMDGDIAGLPDAVFEDGAASPEPEPFSVDALSLSPEQLSALEAHYAAQLAPKLQAEWADKERLWTEQRQSLEGKVYGLDRKRLEASAYAAATRKFLDQIMADQGYDENSANGVYYQIQQLANQSLQQHSQRTAQQQQAQTQVETQRAQMQAEYEAGISDAITAMHAYAKEQGLNPTNEKVNAKLMEMFEPVIAAAEAFRENPTDANLKAVNAAKAVHKKWLTEQATMAKRRRDAQPANDAYRRQQQRGVQNVGRGAGGAGPMTMPQMVEAVRAEMAQAGRELPYKEIHTIAAQRFYQQSTR